MRATVHTAACKRPASLAAFSHRLRCVADVTDPALTPRQQEIVEFPPVFFNERDIDGEVMQVGPSKDTGEQRTAPLRHPDVQTVETWHMNWREAARL